MEIREFINEYGRSRLAARLGVSVSLVTHWANGIRQVSPKYVITIAELSDGRLDPHQLRPDIFKKRGKK